jgi:hypothetical protein
MRLSAASAEHQAGLALLNAINREGISIEGTLDAKLDGDVLKIQVLPKPAL